MGIFNRDEFHDFQLTDDEHAATKDYLPEALRSQMRRNNGELVIARSSAYKKALPHLKLENEVRREIVAGYKLSREMAELQGDEIEISRLRKELAQIKRERDDAIAVAHRESEGRVAALAQGASAVHSGASH